MPEAAADDAWFSDAKCRGLPAEMFLPDTRGGTLEPVKAICWGRDGKPICPVRAECEAYARDRHEEGVWGGIYFTPRPARVVRPVVFIDSE